MGRKEGSLTAAQILYPIMQCTDIFFLKANICQLGVDQRKVNMLARDYCGLAGIKDKPIILSHHMLYGLKAGQAKMSKSDPDSAIFMEDTPEDVERKIRNAYCPIKPENVATDDDEMHLVKDNLMNPCLDYAKYILFAQPGFSFTTGGKTFADFEDLKQAFVSGQVGEKALKDQLIIEVNKLLDPVRKHFKEDKHARELLDQIKQWKKENLTAPTSVARLNLKMGAKSVFAVFAPLPSASIQFDALLGVLERLKRAPSDSLPVLWLEDWTSGTLGRVGGNAACIQGFYELLLFGLRMLDPKLMEKVKVCWQGEQILSGPSEYWISVINAGRRCSVKDVSDKLPNGETLEMASQVLASLMHVGDIFALSGSKLTLCCDTYHHNLHQFALDHCRKCSIQLPEVMLLESPKLRLLADGEGVEADVNVMMTDRDVEVNKKVKKAFCEPQNVGFCPPISWVDSLLPLSKEFLVTRKPDNGGDKTYSDVKALEADFASGALHPGDLKPALSKAINAVLENFRTGLKDSAPLQKAQKELDAYIKAQQKKKYSTHENNRRSTQNKTIKRANNRFLQCSL